MAQSIEILQVQDPDVGLLLSSLQETTDRLESSANNIDVGLIGGSVIQQSTNESRSDLVEEDTAILDPSPLQNALKEIEKLKGENRDLSSQLRKKTIECDVRKASNRYLSSQNARLAMRILSLEDANSFEDMGESGDGNMNRPQQTRNDRQPSQMLSEIAEVTDQGEGMTDIPEAVVGFANPVHQRTNAAVDALKALNVDLRLENAQVKADNFDLRLENAQVKADNFGLSEGILNLNIENDSLREENKAFFKEKEMLVREKKDLTRQNIALIEQKEMLTKENGDLTEKNEVLADEKSVLADENFNLRVDNYVLAKEKTPKEVLAAEKKTSVAGDQKLAESENTRAEEHKKPQEEISERNLLGHARRGFARHEDG